MIYAIGTPGGAPRLFIDNPADQCEAGEVAVEISEIGDYLISADGTGVQPRPLTLADQQKAALATLATLASAKLNLWAGGTAPAGGLQVDDVSTARINGWVSQALATKLTGAAFGLSYWIMADNSHHPITGADDFITFAQAALAYKTAAVLNNGNLKTSIAAAVDSTALAAIDPTQGWPT